MATYGIRLNFETVRTLAAASVVGAYTAIGTSFNNAIRMLFIQNLTDETVMFSLDGTNDTIPLPSNGHWSVDVTTNRTDANDGLFIGQGTIVYVRRIGTPTTGDVWVTVLHAG